MVTALCYLVIKTCTKANNMSQVVMGVLVTLNIVICIINGLIFATNSIKYLNHKSVLEKLHDMLNVRNAVGGCFDQYTTIKFTVEEMQYGGFKEIVGTSVECIILLFEILTTYFYCQTAYYLRKYGAASATDENREIQLNKMGGNGTDAEEDGGPNFWERKHFNVL